VIHVLPRVRTKAPCRFFATGRCRKGDECRFSHDLQLEAGEITGNGSASKTPCRFFARAACQKGKEYSFSHDLEAHPPQGSNMGQGTIGLQVRGSAGQSTSQVSSEQLIDQRPQDDYESKDDFIRPISVSF